MIWRKTARDDVRQGLRSLYPRLWRYCLVLTSATDRADDLAQATCLRALENSDRFEKDSALDRWTFRIAQRIWLNELRAQTVRQGGGITSIDEVDLPDRAASPETNILTREVLLEVLALPEAQRSAVMLVYVEGYRYKEAAEILEIPIGTVMSRLAAARGKLVARFEPRESRTG
jgi:RNA polymerase sigma-70 factor, ECF subfamily